MIVTCPQCEASFSLPDEQYKPGRKARCSQCSFVFRLPDAAAQASAAVPAAPAGAKPFVKRHLPSLSQRKQVPILLLVVLICCAGLAYGGYTLYGFFSGRSVSSASSPNGGGDKTQVLTEEQRMREEEQALRVSQIALEDIRQFVVQNDTLQRVVVIQGEAVNNFPTPKEFLQVEARLYDDQKNILAQTQQWCGVTLTLFQLKVLTEKELEDALKNRVAILTNNVDIPPGGRVPFIVVFPRLPDKLASYEVHVINAQDPK